MTDREAVDFLKKAQLHLCVPRGNGKQVTMVLYIEAMAKAINALEEKTMALPIPMSRTHGEWIDESKDALKCSACGKWVYKPFIGGFPTERTQHYNPNYCAFCGASMVKEGDENG